MQISCRSPTEKFSPPSTTADSSPCGSALICGVSMHRKELLERKRGCEKQARGSVGKSDLMRGWGTGTNLVADVCPRKGIPDRCVVVRAKRVDIVPDRSHKQHLPVRENTFALRKELLFRQAPTGSCGMMASLLRRSRSPICPMSSPSTTILPADGSIMRNSASASDDLPAPVRPTMPICQLMSNQSAQEKGLLLSIYF